MIIRSNIYENYRTLEIKALKKRLEEDGYKVILLFKYPSKKEKIELESKFDFILVDS